MCSLAGFGTIQLSLPSLNHHGFIDFHTTAPAAVRENMWQDLIEGEAHNGFGLFLKGRVNGVGYQSIMTPGSLMADYEAVSEFGTWGWQDIIQPAVDHARRGFIVQPHVHEFWTKRLDHGRVPTSEKLALTEAGRRIYFDEAGNLRRLGSRVTHPDMARSLKRIQQGGADVFYNGDMAEEIAADMEKHGGFLSLEDLKYYKTKRFKPLWDENRGHRIDFGMDMFEAVAAPRFTANPQAILDFIILKNQY